MTRTSDQVDTRNDNTTAGTTRFVHAQRPSHATARRVLATGVAAALLTIGLVGGAVATVADEPLPYGYEAGHPDGWFSPDSDDGTVSTAERSIGAAPTPFRQGHEPGRPDGWFVPGTTGVKVAGEVTASTTLVPDNAR